MPTETAPETRRAFGQRLLGVRAQLLTQKELADKVGGDPTTVQAWENGRSYPQVRSLRRLCDECAPRPRSCWAYRPRRHVTNRRCPSGALSRARSDKGRSRPRAGHTARGRDGRPPFYQ
jgi:transcriptional regulator with XRE-family HTH domain